MEVQMFGGVDEGRIGGGVSLLSALFAVEAVRHKVYAISGEARRGAL